MLIVHRDFHIHPEEPQYRGGRLDQPEFFRPGTRDFYIYAAFPACSVRRERNTSKLQVGLVFNALSCAHRLHLISGKHLHN